jgi:flagellar assembly protein FliH
MQTSTPWEVTDYTYPLGGAAKTAHWTAFDGSLLEEPAEAEAAKQADPADDDARQAEAVRAAFEAGRAQGRNEEHQAAQAALAAEHSAGLAQRAALVEGFAREQERYLHEVEHEVVELSLAVAARILRREAQMDPLLLTGAVRVALGQLAETTEVRLRVPESDADLWREVIAHLPNLAVRPQVLPEAGMRLGECSIETRLGSVDLGVRAQLGEIERGFFDRAGRAEARKPAADAREVQP